MTVRELWGGGGRGQNKLLNNVSWAKIVRLGFPDDCHWKLLGDKASEIQAVPSENFPRSIISVPSFVIRWFEVSRSFLITIKLGNNK